MALRKKVSKQQIQLYVEYFEKNDILRSGKLNPGMPPNSLNVLWQQIAETLNNCGSGAIRDPEKWKTTFVEWKSQVRKRARDGKEISELEKRFLKASGLVVVEGMENVPEMGALLFATATVSEEIPVIIEEVSVDNNEVLTEVATETTEAIQEASCSAKKEKGVVRKKKQKNKTLLEQYIKGQETQKEGLRAIAAGLSEIALSINNLAEIIKNKT